jgi:hypothetical protein
MPGVNIPTHGVELDYMDISEITSASVSITGITVKQVQTVDRTKQFTPVTGVIIAKASSPDNIQYSETHAIIATDWSWGEVSVGKDFME